MKIQVVIEVTDVTPPHITPDAFMTSAELQLLRYTLDTMEINALEFKVLDVAIVPEVASNMIPITFSGEDADDHMTIDQFCQYVADGSFNDYDGSGVFATATHYHSAHRVIPSDVYTWRENANEYYITRGKLLIEKPEWATHVVWFNK